MLNVKAVSLVFVMIKLHNEFTTKSPNFEIHIDEIVLIKHKIN